MTKKQKRKRQRERVKQTPIKQSITIYKDWLAEDIIRYDSPDYTKPVYIGKISFVGYWRGKRVRRKPISFRTEAVNIEELKVLLLQKLIKEKRIDLSKEKELIIKKTIPLYKNWKAHKIRRYSLPETKESIYEGVMYLEKVWRGKKALTQFTPFKVKANNIPQLKEQLVKILIREKNVEKPIKRKIHISKIYSDGTEERITRNLNKFQFDILLTELKKQNPRSLYSSFKDSPNTEDGSIAISF